MNIFLKSQVFIRERHLRYITNVASNNIGFIGLGNMGNPMASNILKNDKNNKYKLILCDSSEECLKSIKSTFDKSKYELVRTPSEVAKKANVIVTMLPNDESVETVLTGSDGILKNIQSSSLCIDSSTISPVTANRLANIVKKKGSSFIDAPVSGGVPGAVKATLTFMVGGDAADVERARELILCMGARLFHCGQIGSGQVAKICNNMLLAICMIGTSEAINLGIKLGLDKKVISNIINESTGSNWSSRSYNPCPGVMENVPSNDGYKNGFRTSLMCKDLTLGQNMANTKNIYTPLGSVAHQIYKLLNECPTESTKDFANVYALISGQLLKK